MTNTGRANEKNSQKGGDSHGRDLTFNQLIWPINLPKEEKGYVIRKICQTTKS
jgi:hypothetical protein